MSSFDHAAFADYVSGWNLRFFKPYEFLVLGGRHSDPHSPAFGRNTLPPRELWPNMAATAHVLDVSKAKLATIPALRTSTRAGSMRTGDHSLAGWNDIGGCP